MAKPIAPQEVPVVKRDTIPPEVLDAFNELIAENCSDGRAVVKQEDAIARITQKLLPSSDPDATVTTIRRVIFANGWLNIEEIYRAVGWKVAYDKPSFNENGEAKFTFTA